MAEPLGKELVGTMGGMLIARPLEERLQHAAREALKELRECYADEAQQMIARWKTDGDFRKSVDRNAVFGMAGVTALTDTLSKVFGPFKGIIGEAGEFFARTLPEIMPRVLGPEAEKFIPLAGFEPTREQADAAMKRYVGMIVGKFPRSAMSAVREFNPAKWLVSGGQRMEQAVSACGPLAMDAMTDFWMQELDDTQRGKYSQLSWGFDTPEEVANFLTLPGKEARIRWLEMLLWLNQMRIRLIFEQQRVLFEELSGFSRSNLQPKMVEFTAWVRGHRQDLQRRHPDLLADRPACQPRIRFRMWMAYAVAALLLTVALILNNNLRFKPTPSLNTSGAVEDNSHGR